MKNEKIGVEEIYLAPETNEAEGTQLSDEATGDEIEAMQTPELEPGL